MMEAIAAGNCCQVFQYLAKSTAGEFYSSMSRFITPTVLATAYAFGANETGKAMRAVLPQTREMDGDGGKWLTSKDTQ